MDGHCAAAHAGGVSGINMKFKEDEIIQILKEFKDKEKIKAILEGLSAKEAKVLRVKLGNNLQHISSLDELGKQFKVTRKRIREIEEKALNKLNPDGDPDNDGPEAA